MKDDRTIGAYKGSEKGALLICFGSVHGNEPAGVSAIAEVFKMLSLEALQNPNFTFKGKMIGLRGNTRAIEKGSRFVTQDLNRIWTEENVRRVRQTPISGLRDEELEMKEILNVVESEIEKEKPQKLIVLDIHTTTTQGGIFSIVSDHEESTKIALEMYAPVIRGLLTGLDGTLLHFFNSQNFNLPVTGVAFEAGQHNDPLSVNRAVSAIINCLRTVGLVNPKDVENRHDQLLIKYSTGLPKLAELIYVHKIQPKDQFEMAFGYLNFQRVAKGEYLGQDRHGSILSPQDALMLMPHYQKQGIDGFFLIKVVTE